MLISGLQKTTLLDYPGKIACTVFLGGCNLRCPFCHNADLVLPKFLVPGLMEEKELFEFLEKRKGKLDGICITGGEPTLYLQLPELIAKIKKMNFSVKLDTNGTNPDMLEYCIENRLVDYVAMDIKNCPERYVETCGGIDYLDQIQKSAALLMKGRVEYEFRTTLVNPFHGEQELHSIGKWLQGAKRYFLQNFVDSGRLVGGGVSALPPAEIEHLREIMLPYIEETKIRGI